MSRALKRLMRLRKEIDQTDQALLDALARRFRLVEEIGWLKQELNLPVVQKSRFAEMRRRQDVRARDLKLNKDLVEKLFIMIHSESVASQRRQAKRKKK
ncbi:MAG: hypothetical protein C5B49_05070 [Bdellovibrio sp.]|nr:MAG: hypothetical protein C5B49_05070 [Bdellovibrio sp.]